MTTEREDEGAATTIVKVAPTLPLSKAHHVAVILYYRSGAETFTLRENDTLVIGRSSPADAVVDDESLSRQHARFWRSEQDCWIEDLGSTNGTWLNGERVTRAAVLPEDRISLGSVDVALHLSLAPPVAGVDEVLSHGRFVSALEKEVTRARTFGRCVSLLMIRTPNALSSPRVGVGELCTSLRERLREVDEVGIYGRSSIEVYLPECGVEAAKLVAQKLIAAAPHLLCGIAVFPDAAGSAEELIEESRAAALRATLEAPIETSIPTHCRPTTTKSTHRGGGGVGGGGGIVVVSPSSRALHDTVDRLARTDIPVLIQAETGTGKELVARALHERGPRATAAFRAVNCGSIPITLIESTLFGHERGAFTSADRSAKGIFEQAIGGTIFLDEIGELAPAAQAALLRVLETKRLCRVGGTQEIELDVRVVAATHRDLEAMCTAGAFRSDLFYRLNVMMLTVPPLRERPEEIEPLALQFLAEARERNGGPVSSIDAAALAALKAYSWPGNVRELRNVMERAVVIAQSDTVGETDLSDRVRKNQKPATAGGAAGGGGGAPGDVTEDFKTRIRQFEVELILEALRFCDGNQSEAARRLRMPLRTLVHKIATYELKRSY